MNPSISTTAKSVRVTGSLTPYDSSQGVWTVVKVKYPPKKEASQRPSQKKKAIKNVGSPKRNPFLMLSDFREVYRFTIDRRKLEVKKCFSKSGYFRQSHYRRS